ncbi:GGDEF domain-containing protein [Lysobacter korlensis]|uniref:diguanylate cyclase n=1 Tax=Lysobacter korlensis TaxID=553636 RepID=A0ABV6RH19_9GAMM
MALRAIRTGLMAALMALALPCAMAAPDFQSLLERADRVRSSDHNQFAALLKQLETDKQRATAAQRDHLELLVAYRNVIRGNPQATLKQASELFKRAEDPAIRFRAGLLVANTAAVTRDFPLGVQYLERALAMQYSVPDAETRLMGHGVAAIFYNQSGQYALGLHHAERAQAQASSPRSRCLNSQVRIEALLNLGRAVDDAYVEAAIKECARQKEPIAVGLIQRDLALHWAAQGRVDDARRLLERALPAVEATQYTRLIGEVRALLAEYGLVQGDLVAAEAHARYVHGLAGQGGEHSLPLVRAHRVLYEIAKRRGDLATALIEHEHYAAADKARLDEIKAREYAIQLGRHQIASNTESLAQRNRLLQLRDDVARKEAWNARLAIALLLVVVASLAAWLWRARRIHQALRRLTETDSLTGLSNRRHFRAAVEAALAQRAQRGGAVSLLALDMDHFKRINDQLGHGIGDRVLREVARVGQQHCRDGDLFGRIGGEEFALALMDCDPDSALHIAKALRRAVAEIDARALGCALPVTVSIGCSATSLSGYNYEILATHADAAMYRAKSGGRNRVAMYQPLQQQPDTVPAVAGDDATTLQHAV